MAGATLQSVDQSPQPRELGPAGESAALDVYLRRGYRLIARNWRCAIGELDLVVARAGELVFCEVKARRSASLGGPYEAVTWKKQRKIRALAEVFLANSGLDPQAVRFDVASVSVDARGRPSVHLFEHAF